MKDLQRSILKDKILYFVHHFPCVLMTPEHPACLPEFGVDLQRLGKHLGSHVTHGVPADVEPSEWRVAAEGVENDSQISL